MKHNSQKQFAGIFLDNASATIITKDAAQENSEFAILEKVKSSSGHGGGSEHSINNAKQSEQQKYFKAIAGHLQSYDELLIFGTGQAQEQLQNFLKGDAQFNSKKITIDSSQQLTDPQMLAKVREFFK